MSDNSSCSSDSNTFQMYQDFDILFGDFIPRKDRWDHTWIDWDAHVEKLCHKQHFKREYRMSLQAFDKLVFIYHLHCREMTHTPTHQLPSHLLSLFALESGTWQEASCPIFDMFLEYVLQRPTTALSASLR